MTPNFNFWSNNCYPLPEYAAEQQQEQHQQQHQLHEALLSETCKKQTLTEQISDLCIVEVTEMKKDVKEKTEVKAEVRVYKDGAVQEEQTGAKTSTEKKTKVGANNWLSMF